MIIKIVPMKTHLLGPLLLVTACGSEKEVEPPHHQLKVPERYVFESRFGGGSSVAYRGQSMRHVLVAALKGHVGGLTARIDNGTLTPTTGTVLEELEFFLNFDAATAGELPHGLTTTPAPLQTTWGELGTARLLDKIAGNDAVGQHKDWSTNFVGWSEDNVTSPELMVRAIFQHLETLAIARANGQVARDPAGNAISQVYVDARGRDLRELLQKFLDGAIAFSQGADDYLDDDLEGKGLNSDNTKADGNNNYTALEHAWDEGFGYFGAATDFGDYTDEELAAAGGRPERARAYFDTNGDGRIDLFSEYNFGHSTNAAKRDRGSNSAAPTDLTKEAWDAFRRGRAIITHADGALDSEHQADLKAARDAALGAWEKAIAATAVHYINDVLQDMNKFGTANYAYLDHAKHWSELKGFALSLQFNPHSPLSDADFAELQQKLGDAPVLPGQNGVDAYKTALLEARALLGDAYQFAAANLGDTNGENGW